ncbi:phosphatase PAP2 family protein [Patescibacteria group bacterium]
MNPVVLSASTSNLPITFLASILLWLMLGGLIILWFIDGKIKKRQVVDALLAFFIAWLISEILKSIFPTVRPYELNGKLPLTITLFHSSGAFPSAHAAMAFALSVNVYLHDRRVGLFYILGAILVAFGRVFSNVHYPIDVVAGALLGTAIAVAVGRLKLYDFLARLKLK